METVTKKERLDWIDFARGMGILLVIVGHAGISLVPKYIIYGFHIPLFFIITGICFSVNKDDKFIPFLIKKIKTILVPYFFISFIWLIIDTVSVLISKEFSIGFLIEDIKIYLIQRHYHSIWFLACLFLSEIIAFFLVKLLNRINNKIIAISVILCFFALSFLYSQYVKVKLPWCADLTLAALPFMLIGYLIKDGIKYKTIFNLKPVTCVFLFLICFSVNIINVELFNNSKHVDFSNGIFANYLLFIISSLTGSFALFGLSKIINKNKIINYLGRNSIIFFTVHPMIFNLFPLDNFSQSLKDRIIINSLSVLIIITTIIIIYFINELICKTKLCVLLGKKYVRN